MGYSSVMYDKEMDDQIRPTKVPNHMIPPGSDGNLRPISHITNGSVSSTTAFPSSIFEETPTNLELPMGEQLRLRRFRPSLGGSKKIEIHLFFAGFKIQRSLGPAPSQAPLSVIQIRSEESFKMHELVISNY